MLTTYLKRETTRTIYYASPAGSYLDEFTDWLARCGFHEEIICQYLPGTMRFAVWGEKTYGKLTSLSADALNHFCVHLAKCGQLLYSRGQNSVHWLSAQHFVEFLRLQRKIVNAETPLRPKLALLDLFEHWMQTHRGVKPSTLNNYQPHIVELLSTLGRKHRTAGGEHLALLHLDLRQGKKPCAHQEAGDSNSHVSSFSNFDRALSAMLGSCDSRHCRLASCKAASL